MEMGMYRVILTAVSDSKKQDYMEVRYTTLSGTLVISPYTETAREKTQALGNIIVFTGVQLDQTRLKDWLRDCAPPVSDFSHIYVNNVLLQCSQVVTVCIFSFTAVFL